MSKENITPILPEKNIPNLDIRDKTVEVWAEKQVDSEGNTLVWKQKERDWKTYYKVAKFSIRIEDKVLLEQLSLRFEERE